jgi:hypothetical protein
MHKNQPLQTSFLRRVHEFLFSLNLALVVMLEGNQKPNRVFSLLESTELPLQLRINGSLHLYPHDRVGANIAFLTLALGLTVLIFLLLRASSTTSFVTEFLRSIAGFVSLLALPISWLFVAHLLGPPFMTSNPPPALLLLELAVVIVCAILYAYGRWPIPAWFTIALLALHYTLWGWIVSGGPYFWHDPFTLIFPIAGFCSSTIWVLYASSLSGSSPDEVTRVVNV